MKSRGLLLPACLPTISWNRPAHTLKKLESALGLEALPARNTVQRFLEGLPVREHSHEAMDRFLAELSVHDGAGARRVLNPIGTHHSWRRLARALRSVGSSDQARGFLIARVAADRIWLQKIASQQPIDFASDRAWLDTTLSIVSRHSLIDDHDVQQVRAALLWKAREPHPDAPDDLLYGLWRLDLDFALGWFAWSAPDTAPSSSEFDAPEPIRLVFDRALKASPRFSSSNRLAEAMDPKNPESMIVQIRSWRSGRKRSPRAFAKVLATLLPESNQLLWQLHYRAAVLAQDRIDHLRTFAGHSAGHELLRTYLDARTRFSSWGRATR